MSRQAADALRALVALLALGAVVVSLCWALVAQFGWLYAGAWWLALTAALLLARQVGQR